MPSRKKQRLYNKAKVNESENDWKAYHEFIRPVQCECRKSHDNYLYGLLDPCTDKGHKRLWTYVYIKGMGKDECGVSSLE